LILGALHGPHHCTIPVWIHIPSAVLLAYLHLRAPTYGAFLHAPRTLLSAIRRTCAGRYYCTALEIATDSGLWFIFILRSAFNALFARYIFSFKAPYLLRINSSTSSPDTIIVFALARNSVMAVTWPRNLTGRNLRRRPSRRELLLVPISRRAQSQSFIHISGVCNFSCSELTFMNSLILEQTTAHLAVTRL
jgi:hypothetical protein